MSRHPTTKPTHNHSVIGHVIFFGFALAVLVGLSLYFQHTTSVLLGSMVFILAHVAVASGLLYLGGRLLFRKFHAPPAARTPFQENLKTLETEGNTIRWAFFYDLLVKGILLGKEENLRASIVDLAQLQPGEKVLDVGCGTGSLAITAKVKAGASIEMYGRDAAPEMIARARQKAAKAGVAIDFQTGVVEAIDFPEDTFDVAVSSFMVHHLPGGLKAKAFAEMYRVLKSGGRLLVVDFEPPHNRFLVRILPLFLSQEMMKIDNSQMPPLLEGAGFMSVKTGNAGHRLASFVWGQKPS
jgi:demethylmenaquinone methyltransferase/2-methoxy-6-polyprenyl-1,4-benzoquinol methylase/phosphoethanolamine N-methyltransferase